MAIFLVTVHCKGDCVADTKHKNITLEPWTDNIMYMKVRNEVFIVKIEGVKTKYHTQRALLDKPYRHPDTPADETTPMLMIADQYGHIIVCSVAPASTWVFC